MTSVEVVLGLASCLLQVQPEMGHPVVYSSAGAIMARFNISKDSIYFPAGKRKGDKAGGISRLHTLQASNMSTIPLTYPQRPEMFHRPQGLWNPLVTKKLHVKNQSKLQSKRRCMLPTNLITTSLSVVDRLLGLHFSHQDISYILGNITYP